MNVGLLDKVKPNWQESFTLWSSGPLNVNEAPPELIAAVFSIDPKRVTFFTDARNGRDKIAGTSDDVPVTSADNFAAQLGIGTTTLAALAGMISLRRRESPHRKCWPISGYSGHYFRCNAFE